MLEAIDELYGGDGPDLLEVPDYHAEGFALVQARRSGHRDARAAPGSLVRAHTSWELCALLDGQVPVTSPRNARCCAMERYVLRHADHLLWAGGDILADLRAVLRRDALAPAARIRHPLPRRRAGRRAPDAAGPLSFLYVGRMERRKGVLDLVRGFMRHAGDDWRLTLVGERHRSRARGARRCRPRSSS